MSVLYSQTQRGSIRQNLCRCMSMLSLSNCPNQDLLPLPRGALRPSLSRTPLNNEQADAINTTDANIRFSSDPSSDLIYTDDVLDSHGDEISRDSDSETGSESEEEISIDEIGLFGTQSDQASVNVVCVDDITNSELERLKAHTETLARAYVGGPDQAAVVAADCLRKFCQGFPIDAANDSSDVVDGGVNWDKDRCLSSTVSTPVKPEVAEFQVTRRSSRKRRGRGDLLVHTLNLFDALPLHSSDTNVRVAALELLREVAKDTFVVEELERSGLSGQLEYLFESANAAVAHAAQRAAKAAATRITRCMYGPLLTLDEIAAENRASLNVRQFSLFLKQYSFRDCGVGFKVWPAAHILARWMYDHRAECIEGKHVLEIGAGPGLLALVAGRHGATSAIGSDYLPDILKMVSRNAARNFLSHCVHPLLLDYNDIVSGSVPPPVADVIVGSDLIYGHALSELVADALVVMLRQSGPSGSSRVFYGVMQANRLGVDEFAGNCESRGLRVERSRPPAGLYEDFYEECIWDFFTVYRG